MDNDKYSIKAAERCFQILDLCAKKNGPISISDVCQDLDVNTNMAFRLLSTIQACGYMDKNSETGLYTLSMKNLKLSTTALQSHRLRMITMPYLELLWHQYPKANVNMGIKEGDDILIIDRIDGQSLPRTYFTPGKKIPFHSTGLGKVLTCTLAENEIRALAERTGLKRFTPDTITDIDALLIELDKTRKEQVGRDRNEFVLDDNCSAVPIMNSKSEIVAAISVSALTQNMSADEIEGCIPKLKETAMRVSSLLGYNTI